MSVEETLARLESLNAKAVQHNKREAEINGSKKARIQNILQEVKVLNSLGYSLNMELASETEFTSESIQAFKNLLAEVMSQKEAEANRLEAFFEAVENKDYDKIKELTGEDVSTVSYDVEIADSKSVKETAKEVSAQMLENEPVFQIAEGTSPLLDGDVTEVKPTEVPTSESVVLTKEEPKEVAAEGTESVPTSDTPKPSEGSTDAVNFLESALNGSTGSVESVSVEVPVEKEVSTSETPQANVTPTVPSGFEGFNFSGSGTSTNTSVGSWSDNFEM